MKICKKCNKEKTLEEFSISRSKASKNFHAGNTIQYKPNCKECTALLAKEWRKANPDYHKSYRKGKISKYTNKYLISAIRDRVTTAKQNNKRTGKDFTIDADYMYELFEKQKGICYLTGFKILLEKNSPYSLSIDKLIPEKGYIKGNVKWSCWMANRAKGDLTIKDLLHMCKAIQVKCRDYPEMEYTQVSGSGEPLEKE